jgi:hypothetical protein
MVFSIGRGVIGKTLAVNREPELHHKPAFLIKGGFRAAESF